MEVAAKEEILTAEEVAEWLKLHRRTVIRMAAEGELPAFRPTGRRAWRFRRSEVERLLRGGE